METNKKIDVQKLMKKEKDSTTLKETETTEDHDLLLIESSIKDFKSEFLKIFMESTTATSLSLVSTDDKDIELSLFREYLLYENHEKTGSDGSVIIDFKTNTLRSHKKIIKNVAVLKKLFKRINRLVKGLEKGRVEMYEVE
jgi:hypothetical protein